MFYNCLFIGKCNENDYIKLFIKRHSKFQLTFWRYQNLRTQVKVKSFIINTIIQSFKTVSILADHIST